MSLLMQAVQAENLRRAWEAVAENGGMPGVDDISLRTWRRHWEERLMGLARAVRTNTYTPRPLRLRQIPKRSGGMRTLRIPTVTDRVLQRAVLQVLNDIYEPRFLDCSYGYRPRRSLRSALAQIILQRENGLRWVLDADIDAFFDQVDHELLLRFLQNDLPDESLLALISCWLETARAQPGASRGIAQGSPLSPLLANVYLHRLDLALTQRGRRLVRYADDFIVFARTQQAAQNLQTEVAADLAGLRLQLEPQKTRIASFDEGFTFLGVHFREDTYSFTWEGKEVCVAGAQAGWLWGQYLPEYE